MVSRLDIEHFLLITEHYFKKIGFVLFTPIAFSLPYYYGLLAGTIQYGTGYHAANAAIYNIIYQVAKSPIHNFGVGVFFYHIAWQRGAEYWVTKAFENAHGDGIIWYAQANGGFFTF